MVAEFDSEEIYCRKLGHHLTFRYCRLEKENLPCSKITDCWFERIKIGAFLKEHFTEEEITCILNPPKQKVETIFDLIQKARSRGEGSELFL